MSPFLSNIPVIVISNRVCTAQVPAVVPAPLPPLPSHSFLLNLSSSSGPFLFTPSLRPALLASNNPLCSLLSDAEEEIPSLILYNAGIIPSSNPSFVSFPLSPLPPCLLQQFPSCLLP